MNRTMAEIKVFNSGKIYLNGNNVTLEQMKKELTKLKSVSSEIYFNRELEKNNYSPESLQVIQTLTEFRMLIHFSDKTDFSNNFDENGIPILNTGKINALNTNLDVVAQLCQHIFQNGKEVIMDTNHGDAVWFDGAMLEVGTNFPAALQQLIARHTQYHDIWQLVRQLDAENTGEWKDASVIYSAQGAGYVNVKSLDGKVRASVNSIYVEYLNQRYPTASIRVKGDSEPVIFVVAGRVRGAVMPYELTNNEEEKN